MCPKRFDELAGGKPAMVFRGPAALFQVSSDVAATAMRLLATMSLIDQAMTSAVSAALRADYHAVCAMLEKVVGARRRNEARVAALRQALKCDDAALEYFERICKSLPALGEFRNKLAHDVWAALPKREGLLVLIPVKSLSAREADQKKFIDDARAEIEQMNPKPEDVLIGPLPDILDPGAAVVYTHAEIGDTLRRAVMVCHELNLFASLVGNRQDPQRAEHIALFSRTISKRLVDS